MKEGITLKIEIIDMPMGTGKTIGVINYIESNYGKLNKKQVSEMAVQYMKAVYMRNGSAHVDATNEMLESLRFC